MIIWSLLSVPGKYNDAVVQRAQNKVCPKVCKATAASWGNGGDYQSVRNQVNAKLIIFEDDGLPHHTIVHREASFKKQRKG